MPRLLSAFTLAFCLSTAVVHAADIYDRGPPPPDYRIVTDPVAFSWTGLYLGAHAGYAWGSVDNRLPGIKTFTNEPSGFAGGVFLGFNQMLTRNLVGGIEADVTASRQEGRRSVQGVGWENANDWYGTLRGRFGIAFDRIMPFVTAGLAFGDVNVSHAGNRKAQASLGWVAGAGLEGALTDHVLLRAEYQFLDFGTDTFKTGGQKFRTDSATHVLRAGVAFKF